MDVHHEQEQMPESFLSKDFNGFANIFPLILAPNLSQSLMGVMVYPRQIYFWLLSEAVMERNDGFYDQWENTV